MLVRWLLRSDKSLWVLHRLVDQGNTISMSSRPPTGRSTSTPKAAPAAANSWQWERRRKSRRWVEVGREGFVQTWLARERRGENEAPAAASKNRLARHPDRGAPKSDRGAPKVAARGEIPSLQGDEGLQPPTQARCTCA